MKKLIAILTIMIVLAGAIFAETATTTGNEELKVTCVVTSKEPTFTLYGSKTAATVSTGMTAGQVVAQINTSTAAIAMETDAIINGDTYIYCVVRQENDNVKSVLPYTLSVAATALSDGTSAAGHTTAAPTVSTIAAIAASNITGARTTAGGTTATVTYAGLDADAADLASFNVKWPKTDLIPGSGYYAYITLTIASN